MGFIHCSYIPEDLLKTDSSLPLPPSLPPSLPLSLTFFAGFLSPTDAVISSKSARFLPSS